MHGLPLTYFWSVWSMGRCMGKTKTIIYQIFSEPEPQNLEHTAQLIIRCPDTVVQRVSKIGLLYLALRLLPSKRLGSVQVVPVFWLFHQSRSSDFFLQLAVVPRFGVGSKSCAGSEKRTEAMSATPTNLWKIDRMGLAYGWRSTDTVLCYKAGGGSGVLRK